MNIEKLGRAILDSAFSVHRALGPGLLESTYQACLYQELLDKGIFVEKQKALPVIYKTLHLECGYRIDLLVENQIVVELKSVEGLAPIHVAQILTYLKLSNKNLGFLINFNVPLLKEGIKRVVNNYESPLEKT